MVPTNCWKVVVLSIGINDVSRITSDTCGIAINTPNNNGLSRQPVAATLLDALGRIVR